MEYSTIDIAQTIVLVLIAVIFMIKGYQDLRDYVSKAKPPKIYTIELPEPSLSELKNNIQTLENRICLYKDGTHSLRSDIKELRCENNQLKGELLLWKKPKVKIAVYDTKEVISVEYVSEKFPFLNKKAVKDLVNFSYNKTIIHKECFGTGELMFNEWFKKYK